jgi:hypothetical protein
VLIHPRSARFSGSRRLLLSAVTVAVTAVALTGTVLPAQAEADGVQAPTTVSTTKPATPVDGHLRTITYAGLSVTVPASWPVIDLAKTPKACVRVDRHAVYLGTPAADQDCPARITGHTEALLLAPAVALRGTQAGLGARVSDIGTAPALTTQARQSGQFAQTFAAARVTALASFGAHPETVRAVLASITKVSAFSLPQVAPATAGLTDNLEYGKVTTGTHYAGMGFDTCASPSSGAMKAWLASPFRSLGIYIGGRNRACLWGNLSSTWVSTVAKMGWRLQPIYVGLQPACTNQGGMADISRNSTTARSQGRTEGADAVSKGRALGLYQGSTLYSDIESYNTYDKTCVDSTMAYLDGFVRAVHDRGYLAGVYSSAYSAIQNLAQRYESPTQAMPDVVWTARWDGVATTSEKVLQSAQWSFQARAKQYRGDHTERFGGYSIRIDSNYLDAMVASMAYGYHTRTLVNVRTAPTTAATLLRRIARGTSVQILCQATGISNDGDPIWNKLTDGTWISDRNITTPSVAGYSAPVPKCTVVYQTWRGIRLYATPSGAHQVSSRPYGSLTHTVCQKLGTKVGDSSVWDKLQNGVYIADYNLANGLNTWNPSVPRCMS